MRCKASDCFTCPYPDCINDYVAERKPLTPEQKAKQRAYYLEKRAEARADGLCGLCWKRPAMPGRTACVECRNRYNRNRREARHMAGFPSREEMDGVHLCKACGKAKPKSGFKLCETCYERAIVALSKTPVHNGKGQNNYFGRTMEWFYGGKNHKVERAR